jgi:hypothetical protein
MKPKTQTYNDGIVKIYSVGNIAAPGNMPKDGLTLKISPLRYEERIVGMGRYWTAMQVQAQIDRIIRVPRIESISSQDVAIPIDGKQYQIKQVQYVPDIEPPSMDLSLERLEAAYDIA